MSAEVLREAAALMRERALNATGGEWSAYDGTAAPTHVRSRWTDQQGRRCQQVVLTVARAYLGTPDRSRPGLGTAGVTGAQPDEPVSQAGRPVAGGGER